jgi:hypothetical protein
MATVYLLDVDHGAVPTIVGSVGGLVAAGTTQATALQLSAAVNGVGTVASGTGVVLPPWAASVVVVVINAGANALQIYGSGTNTIDGTAGSTGVALSTAHRLAFFIPTVAGAWVSALGGAVSS